MSCVHVIDFGLANRYQLGNSQSHIPYARHTNITGTARFLSINGHQGIEQSRRDNLESLAYALIYFLRRSLPWQGLEAISRKNKYARIMKTKIATANTLCAGLPSAFKLFLHYSRNLAFDAAPDYQYLHTLFGYALDEAGLVNDGIFDWSLVGADCTIRNGGDCSFCFSGNGFLWRAWLCPQRLYLLNLICLWLHMLCPSCYWPTFVIPFPLNCALTYKLRCCDHFCCYHY